MSENKTLNEVDVRDDIKKGMEPFKKIMEAAEAVQPGGQFILHAPFNPFPLFKALGKKGFTHESERIETKQWKITFTKADEEA
ncbi:DUF2249 domain-containing protein [Aquibacillus koreensis]|uniref:DUF2249 domain-containing protein n=1 Tax=Aquibacillus koreensis TaxID=279446 RepID=A0A9X4AK18_9BACI|nr:DUF2249 domain-containing protein [Aquibacillus koreensis]MCT2536652.1 DUF2249 domain-containing protein [Aquibacillus koreensis]MDC3422606.1 DUF2249 domain-containing protein [Aquibacillus koreensis]